MCLLLFSLIFWLGSVYGVPEITYVSENQLIEPGSDTALSCSIRNLGNNSFGWVKMNRYNQYEQISLNDKIKIVDSRYSIMFDDYSAINTLTYQLFIRNVTVNDNGTYECLVYVNDRLVFHNHTSLLVMSNDVKREYVLLGDSASLRCVSSQFRFAYVIWTRFAHSILPTGSSVEDGVLTIPSTIANDTGHYVCRAEFFFRDRIEAVTRHVQLVVFPPLEITARIGKIVRPLGYDVNMTCIIDSKSSVFVRWTKDNEPVSQNSRIQQTLYDTQVEHGSFSKPLQVTTLYLKNIVEDDYGLYDCSAENDFGIKSDTIKLVQFL